MQLEKTNNELKIMKMKLEEQMTDMEQLLKTESQTSQNLTLSLERESELRIQLENQLRLEQVQKSG